MFYTLVLISIAKLQGVYCYSHFKYVEVEEESKYISYDLTASQ